MMFLTWNMGNAPPPQDLSEVFGNRKDVTQDMVGAFALQYLFACCRERGQHKDNSDTHTHQLILASLWLSQIIIGLQECIYTPSDPNEMIQKHRRNKKLVRSVSVCVGICRLGCAFSLVLHTRTHAHTHTHTHNTHTHTHSLSLSCQLLVGLMAVLACVSQCPAEAAEEAGVTHDAVCPRLSRHRVRCHGISGPGADEACR